MGNRINFDGHLFGKNATFAGHLEEITATSVKEDKKGFTITCNKCGSKEVFITGADFSSVHISCEECNNES
jgi:uncharacterized protein (DUF983 family)